MKSFENKFAVVTGGGAGMGRELVRQLVAEGCNVAMCDVSADAMAETTRLCEAEKLPQGLPKTYSRAPMPEASPSQAAAIAKALEGLGALGSKRVEAAE